MFKPDSLHESKVPVSLAQAIDSPVSSEQNFVGKLTIELQDSKDQQYAGYYGRCPVNEKYPAVFAPIHCHTVNARFYKAYVNQSCLFDNSSKVGGIKLNHRAAQAEAAEWAAKDRVTRQHTRL